MTKKKMGRPRAITPEVIRKLEEAFAIGASVLSACFYANVPTSTFYDYLRDNPDFSDRIDQLKERPVLKALKTRDDLVGKGDWQATKDVLDRHYGKAPDKVELTGKEGKDFIIVVADERAKKAIEEI